jgi:DNA-binding NarL/FixJ family response regulator
VLVVDPPLPDASAGEALQRLAAEHPTTATLVLLQQPDPSTVRRACRLGARGVHDIAISDDTLRAALMRMDGGDVAMQPNLVRYLLEPDLPDGDGEANGSGASVPARELTVLQLLARGYTSKQIAPLLGTTSKAVDLLAERAARRLSAANRTEAVATALRRGLLT